MDATIAKDVFKFGFRVEQAIRRSARSSERKLATIIQRKAGRHVGCVELAIELVVDHAAAVKLRGMPLQVPQLHARERIVR